MRKCVLSVATAAVTLSVGAISAPASASKPFIGEIKWFAGNFAPRGYAFCDGQLLSISSNPALFSILGTTYGGDGRTTFALPDARGRALIHEGTGAGLPTVGLGERGGATTATLSQLNLPSHTHGANSTGTLHATDADGTDNVPTDRLLADDGRDRIYAGGTANVTMSNQAVSVETTVDSAGGSQVFSIRDPYIGVSCIIALDGTFPSRS